MTSKTVEMRWTMIAMNQLRGKTIKTVRYMSEEEAKDHMWSFRPLAIFFTDGSFILPMADDEGNDGGALYTSDEKEPIIPVI